VCVGKHMSVCTHIHAGENTWPGGKVDTYGMMGGMKSRAEAGCKHSLLATLGVWVSIIARYSWGLDFGFSLCAVPTY